MIRKASKRGHRGFGVSIPIGFADIVSFKKGDNVMTWVEGEKLFFSTKKPKDKVVNGVYRISMQESAYIITLLPEWVKANKVEATMPLSVSIKDNCIVVQKA